MRISTQPKFTSTPFLLTAFLCALGSFAKGVQAATGTPPRQVQVSGECLKDVGPDRGRVVLTSEVLDSDAGTAAKKVAQAYEKIRKDLKKLNLKDESLQTVNHSVNEDVDWSSGKKVRRGFRATMGLAIETSDIQRLGEVIQVGSQNKVENIQDLRAFLSPARLKAERESCLELAIKNARQKAEKMAAAAGAKVGEVLSIVEGGGMAPPPGPVPMLSGMTKMSSTVADVAPPVETKDETVQVFVSVAFALR
jgi:uncharacterized protein